MEEKRVKDVRQICIDIFGTDKETELKEIAEKAKRFDALNEKEYVYNSRNAGRKAKFCDEDVKLMLEMSDAGNSIQRIATYFHTSRQTIYKYIKEETN